LLTSLDSKQSVGIARRDAASGNPSVATDQRSGEKGYRGKLAANGAVSPENPQ
jgi:hypothetical protein